MIDSVSNYCNRWCERCPFTDRCSLVAYSPTEELPALGEELVPLPASFPAMSGRFGDFLQRLDQQLKVLGSSLAEVGYGVGEETPAPTGLSPAALEALARQLSMMMLQFKESGWAPDGHRSPDFSQPDVQALVELRWYQIMIGPKYRRTAREVSEPNEHTERDAAFTARLTHLVIARAICGITILLETHGRSAYSDLRELLEGNLRLLAGLRQRFPEAYRHRRPGFDDAGERRHQQNFFKGHLPVDPFEDGTWSPGGRAPEA